MWNPIYKLSPHVITWISGHSIYSSLKHCFMDKPNGCGVAQFNRKLPSRCQVEYLALSVYNIIFNAIMIVLHYPIHSFIWEYGVEWLGL